uniref:Transcription factor S-II (TFIIS) n=1 Tax=Myoviridae sp. ctyWv1 TaxID=2826718 RepID=A0A8S5QW72_9CAUD|nr:MAG TPA: Transcription factor S-II (TFIIS) [Myoviridae sp. ctyWv1]
MCSNCIHRWYCPGAFRKDHWCGNHQTRRKKE